MSPEIRKVQTGDEKSLAYIQTESWKAAFRDILDEDRLHRNTDPARAEAMYKNLLEEETGHGYLLTDNDRSCCFAWWDSARDPEFAGKAELICIHCLPGNWRKGYGSAMMDRILSDVRDAGYADIVLWVFSANSRARAFYEAKGFYPTNHRKNRLDAEEICYMKNL